MGDRKNERRERIIELAQEGEEQRAEERETIRKQRLTDEGQRVPGVVGEQVRRRIAREEGGVRRDLSDEGPYFLACSCERGGDSVGEVGKQGSSPGGEEGWAD